MVGGAPLNDEFAEAIGQVPIVWMPGSAVETMKNWWQQIIKHGLKVLIILGTLIRT